MRIINKNVVIRRLSVVSFLYSWDGPSAALGPWFNSFNLLVLQRWRTITLGICNFCAVSCSCKMGCKFPDDSILYLPCIHSRFDILGGRPKSYSTTTFRVSRSLPQRSLYDSLCRKINHGISYSSLNQHKWASITLTATPHPAFRNSASEAVTRN